jgi:predicted O-methyltransferase YrrM
MTFTEEWFGEESQIILDRLVRMAAKNTPGMIVEIGAWEGRSTVIMANAAAPQQIHTCDTWEGSAGEISAELAAERDVYATWRSNVDQLTAGNVVEHRMGWREYVPTIDEQITLAFIDAEHSYREVRDNIKALLPLMAPGGIICGDDAHHEPVRRAVMDVLGDEETYTAATLWIWQAPSQSLADIYATLCETPSDIYKHLPRMVELVRSRNAQHVIELGSRTGVSTIAWLYALESTGGRLTSVDLDRRPPLDDYPHWTFLQANDVDPNLIAHLDPADIVFIDTSHLYEHTRQELDIYRWLLKPGGLLVLHDTELRHPIGAPELPEYPVRTAVEGFCVDNGLTWENHPECFGLGVIEVPG